MLANISQVDKIKLKESCLITALKFSYNNGENGMLKTIRAHIGKVWKKECDGN
jgi:hypothetical protein